MEFRILGSLEVVHHGRALDLGTPQRRALLAMLLLQANQVVAVDVLAEGLWANDPPADPNAALQVQVSRLRKVLAGASEDEPSLITRHKPGYAMCIGADDLDAWRFERLVGDVTGALSGGRPAVASQMLAAALGLWRGPALADFAYAGFAQAEIARLSELRLGAIEALMEARLELGAHRDLVAELEGLVAAHPLRERFWEQRMLALYRCGRQAEALRAYQEVRRLLGDELGIEPSPELTQLEKAILLHQPELDWSPAPLAVGHNHLRSARSPAQPAPLRRRDNLPLQLTTFIGRAAERAELVTRLAGSRLLTLTGIGGCGKTRLAMKVVSEVEPPPTDGVWSVDLSSLLEPSLVTRSVAVALGVREEPGSALGDTLAAALERKHLVLVLDNCEHVLAACAELAGGLLERCPGVRILATSREPLGVAGETAWRVPSLSLPTSPAGASYEAIRRSDAVGLFVDRAALVHPEFALRPDNALAVATICERVDGIALAIELAAARVDALSLAQITAGLEDRFRLLTTAGRSVPLHHQTLESAIDWGHELLSAAEQGLFRRLSVFANGFTVESAEAVCAGGEVRADSVADLLESLVAKSFVVADPLAGEARYRLLDTIRHYGKDRLVEAAETAATGERHAAWYLAVAERADTELSGTQRLWLERLEAEHGNLNSAFEWSMARRRADWALRLAGALTLFWRVRGHYSEGLEWCEAALSIGPTAAPAARAQALWGRAFLAAMLADFSKAVSSAEESLELFRELGGTRGAARALLLLGNAEIFAGAPASALRLLKESVALARDVGDAWCLATALSNCGQVFEAEGHDERARPFHEECLTVARLGGNEQGVALALNRLGYLALKRGEYRSAETLLTEALGVARELEEPYGTAKVLTYLGTLYTGRGAYNRGSELLQEALALEREVGSPSHAVVDSLCALGRLELATGRVAPARVAFEEAIEAAGPAGNRSQGALQGLADAAALAGEPAAARSWAEKALVAADRAADKRGRAVALHQLGALARSYGDLDEAASLHQAALSLRLETGDLPGQVASVEALAGVAAAEGRWDDATRLLGATQSVREQQGYHRASAEQPGHAADVELARRGRAQAFEAAWREGAAMPMDVVVSLARRVGHWPVS